MRPQTAVARRSVLAVGAQALLNACASPDPSSANLPLNPAAALPAQQPAQRLARWRAGYRGFNVGLIGNPRISADLFASARAYGADLVRAFVPWPAPTTNGLNWARVRREVSNFVTAAAGAGLSVVLVADTDSESRAPLWCKPEHTEAFVRAWGDLARDLRNRPSVAGFDLLNEPNPPARSSCSASSVAIWNDLVRRTLVAIRAEDAAVPVVIEGILGGNAQGLLALERFDDEALVYSLHFYTPHEITHQRVSPRWPRVLRYPTVDASELQGTAAYPGPWNRDRLRIELEAAAARGRAEQRPVYVGEFSCVRWAPDSSALRYVDDCLALFAAFGWSWTYHEFRGWPGWDPEVNSDDTGSGVRRADAPVIGRLRAAMKNPQAAPALSTGSSS